MSVSPVTGASAVQQQPTAAQIAAATAPATSTATQSAPTVDAAQAWEEAMRAAMGDEASSPTSSDPLSALNGQAGTAASASQTTTGQTTASQTTAGQTSSATTPGQTPSTALTPQALAALISGGSTASPDPLVTSLSAPSAATPTSDASAGTYL